MLNKIIHALRAKDDTRCLLVRGHGYETEDEVMQAARSWLLDGWAVCIVRKGDGTFTLEAWEV